MSNEKQEGVLLAYREVVSLSLQFHGGIGMAYDGGHMRAPT
jgi:hypothetical protein